MSDRTHTHEDLTYVGRRGEIATFGAPSRHNPRVTNLVDYDIRTGETHCTCKFCETHPEIAGGCWLTRNVALAWCAREYRVLPTDELRELDRRYAAEHAALTPEQLRRWNLVGDELLRRQTTGRRAA